MPNKITYTITTSDGKSHQVDEQNINKYGMQSYADAYKGATIRMRDKDGADYDIPLNRFTQARGQGLRPSRFEHRGTATNTQAGSHAQQVADEYDESVRRTQPRMTAAQKAKMSNWASSFGQNVGQATRQATQALKRQNDARKDNALRVRRENVGVDAAPYKLGENPNVVETSSTYNPQSGKVEKTYLTEAGNEYVGRDVADLEQNIIDDQKAREMDPVNTTLRDAYAERDRLEESMRQRMKEIDEERSNVNPVVRAFADLTESTQGGQSYNPFERYQRDEQYRQLEAAARKNRATIQTLEDKRDNKMNDFFHSIATTAANGYTFNDGLSEINDAIALLDARKHINSINRKQTTGEPLTEEEQAAASVLAADALNAEVQGQYAGDYGAWARAGQMVPTSIDLMKDIMLTPGAGGVAKGVAGKVAGIGTRFLAKQAGETAAKSAAKAIGRSVLKGTGILLGAHTAGAVVSNTAGIGRTIGAMGTNLAGQTVKDAQGNYKVQDSMDVLDAFVDAERNQIRENGSEMFGVFIPGAGGLIKKGLEKIGLSKISNALTNIGNKQWYQQYNRLLTAGGRNGIPGEALEEYEGMAFDALTGNAGETWQQLKDPRTHVDIWLGTAAMSALLGAAPVTIQGAHTAMYYRYKHATDKADRTAAYRFGDNEKWNGLKEVIDNTPNEDMANAVMDIMNDSSLYPEQKTAALNYVRNLTKMRGYNIGQMSNANEESEESKAANESYANGYNTENPEELNQIKNRYEVAREKALQAFPQETLDEIENDNSLLVQYVEAPTLRKIVVDYLNTKQAYDGMIQRVRDDIDTQVQQSNDMIESRINKTTGMIQPAMMKAPDENGNERRAYVISGNVEMLADMSGVDREKSDGSILVRYADTGEMEMVSPSAIMRVDDAISPEQEQQEAETNITQTYAQQKANDIDGKVAFAQGDVYTLTDEAGKVAQVTVVPNKDGIVDNGDGTVNVDAGTGEVVAMPKDAIQIMIDRTNKNKVVQQEEPAAAVTYNLNDDVYVQDENGNIVHGVITGDVNEDGQYEVQTDTPVKNVLVNLYTPDQFVQQPQATTTEQPAAEQAPAEQATEQQPSAEQQPANEQQVEQTQAEAAQEEQKPVIPTDEKGNTLYHQVPVETAINDLYDGKLDDNEIRDFVDANINEADKNLEKVNKKAPKIGTNKAEYLKKKQEWQKQVEDATRIRDYWNSVKNYIAQQTHTTPEEVKAAQDELSGEAARREYQDMGGSVQQDAVSVASDFIRGAKITPESFKAETGYGTDEQRKFVGMIAKAENGGKTIDRLAEELVSYDNAEMNGVLFGGDTSSAKDAILSALQGAGTRGELKQTNEAEEQAYIDARNAARDAQYMEQYGMTYEEYLAYEEQIMPTIWREYNNYDETAFNNMYAEEIEQLIKSRENDTTGEEQADDRGNQVLSEQQVTEQRGSEGGTEPGTEVQAGVQSNNENEAAPEEASGERIPNIERGRQGYTGYIARRQQNNLETSEEINVPLSQNEQDEYGNPMVLAENGSTVFGTIESESGLTEAPIKLSLGENKVGTDGKNHGYGLLHIEAGHGEQIRNAGYQSVEQFVENVAQNYTDIKEGALIGKKQTYLLEVSDEHNNTLFIQLSNDGTYWNVNSAGIFKKKYSRRKPLIYTVPAVGKSTVTDTSEVNSGQSMGATAPAGNSSESKDSDKSAVAQTIDEKIAKAEEETDVNPTEGQKEAGNYKKGHVRIDGYDITIEQPKGSVRRGTDADGKQWEQTMNNTYGYIRGTEGVDGDHIDIFLSDNPTEGNVYVVDQVNPDGSFDEHKVMYGFQSADDARAAYLSNYEEGWKGLGTITEVSKDEFKKWVNSSHRKTKPFSEYKSVNAIGAQNEERVDNTDITPGDLLEGRTLKDSKEHDDTANFAKKHNLNEKDVEDYADYIRRGNLNGASRAFKEIRRKVLLDNQGASLGQFAKIFSPIEKELYERFGNIDELRQQYVQRTLDERNAMEAARKKAEEEAEAERRRLQEFQNMSSEQLDAEYMKAVEANDEIRMRNLVNEAARRNGYGDVGSEYQGVGAWSAPSNPGYESDEERRAAVENDAPDVNITDIANGYSQQPSDYFTNLRAYGTDTAYGRESAEAINKAIDEVRNGKDPMVKVYRAVPKSVKEGKLRNGDWVTPSRKYAEMHGDNRLEGDYRIIEQEVPASQIWWDGNDINEWGFDDGKGYAYRNTKNNRKLNDLITRDDKGNIIPLSQRFNARKADVRYRNTENQAATDNIEDVNKQFNQQLEGLTEENADKVMLSLGRPSAVLRAAGVEDKPMKLYGNKVIKKMRKHGFTLAEIKDLPRAVADPIAVFNNYQKNGNRSILTELQIGDKHILVSVTVGKTGVDADFNIVSSVFGKGSNNVVDWINKGYATFINKEKALDYLHFSERSISEASDNQELVSTANIIRNFENPNVLEENLVPTEQTNDIDTAVADTANKLNIGVRVAHSIDEVNNDSVRRAIEQGRRIQGFYDTRTGEIVVYAPNAVDAEDAVRTVLHEGVAHYGLRQLVGEENFGTFLDNIYNNVSDEIKSKIDDIARKNKLSTQVATEEYLASLAENTNFEDMNASWWNKIKDLFLSMVRSIGLKGFSGKTLSDNELRYILWRSYENLKNPGRYRNVFSEAEDIAKQNELKVGNYAVRETRESVADNDLYREVEPEERRRVYVADIYDARIKNGMYQMREAVQDSMLSLREAMTEILKAEGNKNVKIEDIAGFENAYLGENRLSSVNKAEADAFANLLFKPLLEEAANLSGSEKGGRDELVNCMMAKHGLERNKVMAERDAKNEYDNYVKEHPKGEKTLDDFIEKYRKRDYAGLTALTGKEKVAEAEAEAQQIVDDYEAEHDTEELWNKTRAVSNAILDKEYDTGLMSKDTMEKLKSMFDYYIPLRGFDEKTSEDEYAYLENKNSAFFAPIKAAKGRKSKADDPFAYLQGMAENAIMQGNRNKLVKQKFLNFVLNHQSDLASVSDLWLKYNEVNDEWEPVFPDNIKDTDTAKEVERKMQEFEERMQQLAEEEPELYKHGKQTVEVPYRVVESRDLKQHQILVRRNGRNYVITINGNPRAAQAVNGLTNPDNDMSGAIGAILKAGQNLNRQLSAFYTTRNPDFVVSNFIRDALYANSMAWVKERPNYALRFHKNYVLANPIKMKKLFARYRKNKLKANSKTDMMFKQFMLNGGETGYASVRDIEKRKNEISKEIKKYQGKLPIKKAWGYLAERFDEFNRAVENSARFAAFVTSREMGRSIERSIYDAKEISVNFNKKGSGSKFMGATGQTKLGNAGAFISGLGRSGFVFWNAAIQGSTNFGRQVIHNPAKALTAMATMFMLGAVVASLGYGDDDDDDKNSYWNLPDYVRRSNIMFRAGDQWVSIPLPVEYRSLYGLGELMISTMSDKEHLSGDEIANQIAGQISQVMPIDILEGGGGAKAFVPSSIKPFAEAYGYNRSWTGMPIYKDTDFNKDLPEWTKAYKSANKYLVDLSETLNEATGGDKYTKGEIDINPAKIEHVLTGYFGGIANTIDRLTKMGETAIGQREYDPNSILIWNRIVKNGDERTEYKAINNEYFRIKKEHDTLKKRLNNYGRDTENGVFDYAEKIDFLYNSPEYRRLEIYEEYQPDIEDLIIMLDETNDADEQRDIEAQINELKKMMISDINKYARK